jgi:hypothetical protein
MGSIAAKLDINILSLLCASNFINHRVKVRVFIFEMRISPAQQTVQIVDSCASLETQSNLIRYETFLSEG